MRLPRQSGPTNVRFSNTVNWGDNHLANTVIEMTNPDAPTTDLPEPTTPRYDSIQLNDTACIIFDPTAHDGWIQSTAFVPLDDRY